jgi:hypothetical protein
VLLKGTPGPVVEPGEVCRRPFTPTVTPMRDVDAIDSELQLVADLLRAARERGGPLQSIGAADALLDQRRELTEWATTRHGNFHTNADVTNRGWIDSVNGGR